jgi:hypothetical protein
MNASGYSEDEYFQSRESMLQQLEHAYSTMQKVQTNQNSIRKAVLQQTASTHKTSNRKTGKSSSSKFIFSNFFDWIHTLAIRSKRYSAFS